MDKYKINSHKLMYHLERVLQWKNGQHIYPLYLEISPVGFCNFKCSFCAFDFIRSKCDTLDIGTFVQTFPRLAKLGIKAIMFGGEGEPTLHKDFDKLVAYAYNAGINLALTTNGSMSNIYHEQNLQNLSWVKVSFNAGSSDIYAKVHGCDVSMYARVIDNLQSAVNIRNYNKFNCAIGAQMVVMPDNVNDIENFIRLMRFIGVDYVVIKSYSQHLLSNNKIDIDYNDYNFNYLRQFSTNNFEVIIRTGLTNNVRNYSQCYALPFWSYVSTNGDVWACSSYIGNEKFLLGNIYQDNLQKIWDNSKLPNVDILQCRNDCRMASCNQYLHELTYPNAHVNFI